MFHFCSHIFFFYLQDSFFVFWLFLVANTAGISPWHSHPCLLPKAVYCKYLWPLPKDCFLPRDTAAWVQGKLEVMKGISHGSSWWVPVYWSGSPRGYSLPSPRAPQQDQASGAPNNNWLEWHTFYWLLSLPCVTSQLLDQCCLGLTTNNPLHWTHCLRVCSGENPKKTLLKKIVENWKILKSTRKKIKNFPLDPLQITTVTTIFVVILIACQSFLSLFLCVRRTYVCIYTHSVCICV